MAGVDGLVSQVRQGKEGTARVVGKERIGTVGWCRSRLGWWGFERPVMERSGICDVVWQ